MESNSDEAKKLYEESIEFEEMAKEKEEELAILKHQHQERLRKRVTKGVPLASKIHAIQSVAGTPLTVFARVRPFTEKQVQEGDTSIITMPTSNKLVIRDPNLSSQSEEYVFGRGGCLWSHDDFTINDEGEFVSATDRYDDQASVMKAIGEPIVDKMCEGHNCGVFAYGQTNSGKTFSLNNTSKANNGLAQRIMKRLLTKVGVLNTDTNKCQVTLSMLESYNEELSDLLYLDCKEVFPPKLKDSPATVTNLSSTNITDYDQAYKLMKEANDLRMIQAVNQHTYSSRAHTFIYINLIQHNISEKTTKSATLTLADLAGSENNIGGEAGERLKEASMINVSLNHLGSVISALIKGAFVPWRNSKVTRLLQEMLSRNCYTTMLATLSPAASNYNETLTTVRYAQRCEQIKTNAELTTISTEEHLKERVGTTKKMIDSILTHLQAADGSLKTALSNMAENCREQIKEMKQIMKLLGVSSLQPTVNFYSRLVEDMRALYNQNKPDEANEKLSFLMLRLTDDLSVLLMAHMIEAAQHKLLRVQNALQELPDNDHTTNVKNKVDNLLEKMM